MNQPLRSRPNGDWSGLRVLVLSPTSSHPQNFGNRKRVHALCSNLKKRGAHVVFAHYPAEAEWRVRIPHQAEAAMARSWDGFYTIPATRALHSDPLGEYHTIDEWWDEAIEHFLTWLFQVRAFDVFIVNYTWLSKAFEFAPASVTKILDTNDRFSGRKELFRQHGLRPEFFYTTEEEEAKAFARADLILAIKDEERAQFERITCTPVRTLLHADEATILPRAARDPEGYLRVGIIGAKNNVNAMNLRNFLGEAIPVFERYFAPIRLCIAGTVCSTIGQVDPRFVRLVGETSDVDEFYRAIDVACIPVAFSTGLKIKVAEAIARRCPVVSMAHAFEGFPPQHPFHTVSDFRELAERLVELSFQPEMLDELAEASGRAQQQIQSSIDTCLESAREMARRQKATLFYCVDVRAIAADGCMRAVALSACKYLIGFGSVVIVVVNGTNAELRRAAPVMEGDIRIAITREISDENQSAEELRARGFEVETFVTLLARFDPDIIIVDAANPSMISADLGGRTIVYRAAIAAHTFGTDPEELQFARTAQKRFVLGTTHSGGLARLARSGEAEAVTAPCFWTDRIPEVGREITRRKRPLVAVLDSQALVGSKIILELVSALGCEIVHVTPDMPSPVADSSLRQVPPAAFCDQLLNPSYSLPNFAVDISVGALELQLTRELLDLCGVPMVTADCAIAQPSIVGCSVSGRPGTAHDLFAAVVRAVRGEFREAPRRRTRDSAQSGADLSWLTTYMRAKQFQSVTTNPFRVAQRDEIEYPSRSFAGSMLERG